MPTLINFLTNNYAIAALLSSFFAAIAIVLARTLLKEIKSKDLVGLNFLIMAATLVLFSPLFYKFEANFTSMGILMLIAFIDTFANFFYFKTFEENEISTATPILSLAPSFTFIGAFLFLGEKSTLINYGLCILIIILIVAFNIDFKNKLKLKTLKPALISSLLFGISAIPSKYLLSNLSAINAPTLYMFRAGFIALFGLLIFNFKINHISQNQLRLIFLRGLFVISQWTLLYLALSKGNAGISMTLANTAPIFVFFMGVMLLGEKANFKKFLTAAFILILSLLIR